MLLGIRSAALAAAVLGAAVAAPAASQERHRGRASDGADRQFEVVRRELAAYGIIVDTAPDINGERTTRRASLLRGRDACQWIVLTDAEVTLRRVSAERYRYTMTIDLAALDPDRIAARKMRDWEWCCRRSAEVAFADTQGRQSILTRYGDSWSVSERAWLHFSDEGAARRAATALADAVRACRRPGF